jgi:hypothetical protein
MSGFKIELHQDRELLRTDATRYRASARHSGRGNMASWATTRRAPGSGEGKRPMPAARGEDEHIAFRLGDSKEEKLRKLQSMLLSQQGPDKAGAASPECGIQEMEP